MWDQVKFSLPAIFIVLFIVLVPTSVEASYSFKQSCGGGYGSNTHRFSTERACKNKLAQTKAAINRQGGGCSFSRCSPSGGTGTSSGSGSNFDNAMISTLQNLNSKSAIGNNIINLTRGAILDLFSGGSSADHEAQKRQRELARKERERIQRERRKQACDNKKADQKQFRNDKVAVLGQMKGMFSSDGNLGSELEIGIVKMDFDTYLDDQRTRREALTRIKGDKKLHGWCLMHAPLRPTPPIGGPDCNFELALDRYNVRMIEWKATCSVMDIGAETDTKKVNKSESSSTKSRIEHKLKDLEFKLQDPSVVDLRDKDTSQPIQSPSFKNK